MTEEHVNEITSGKAQGPIWLDFFPPEVYTYVTIADLARIANLALNRLTMRDIAEIFTDVDIGIEIALVGNGDDAQ